MCSNSYLTALFLAAGLVSTSCNSRKTVDQGLYYENFDNLRYWSHDVSVTSEKAHSGKWAAFTDSSHEFSQKFAMEYPYIILKGYQSVTVSAWVYKTGAGDEGKLVASLESHGTKHAYIESDLSTSVKDAGKWEQVSCYLKIPDNAPGIDNLEVYLWSPQRHKIFLDDLSINLHK